MEEIIRIKADWDVDNSSFLTKKLYKYVASGQIKFDLNANKGSVLLNISIGVIAGLGSNILYDLIKFIYKKLKKEKEMGRNVKPVEVISHQDKYIITGDEKTKVPLDLEKWLSREIKKEVINKL